MKRIAFFLMLILTVSPVFAGIIYMEYFQGERAFINCLERINPAILVIDYGKLDGDFYFAYSQKPLAEVNNVTWRDLANCHQKHIPDTSIIIVAVVIYPFLTVDRNLEFGGFVQSEGLLTPEQLVDAENIGPEDFVIYPNYEVPFSRFANGHHLTVFLNLMRKYYANKQSTP